MAGGTRARTLPPARKRFKANGLWTMNVLWTGPSGKPLTHTALGT